MSVERTTATQFRVRKQPYFVSDAKLIEELATYGCPAAIGIWVYLANKRHDWIIRKEHLKKKFAYHKDDNPGGLSRERLDLALGILREVGVLMTVNLRDKGGHLAGKEIVVSNCKMVVEDADQEDETQDVGDDAPPNIRPAVSSATEDTAERSIGAPNIRSTERSVDRTFGDPYPLTNTDVLPNAGEHNHPQGESVRDGPDNSPLKKDSPALRMRINQPHSAEYEEFLGMMVKSPRRKGQTAELWYQDRGGWSFQTIWHDQIKPALLDRIANCALWETPKYWAKPDQVLEEQRWEDKIVPKVAVGDAATAAVDWREEADANV